MTCDKDPLASSGAVDVAIRPLGAPVSLDEVSLMK